LYASNIVILKREKKPTAWFHIRSYSIDKNSLYNLELRDLWSDDRLLNSERNYTDTK